MPTQIKQIDHPDVRTTILRVEGDMFQDDAVLLERIAVEIRADNGNKIIIDLADLDFLDSDAAPILRRLSNLDGFVIEGVEVFLQSAVDRAERRGA